MTTMELSNERRSVHKFLPNSEDSVRNEMLRKIGLSSVEQLFSDVPEDLKMKRPLDVPDSLSEIELERAVRSKLSKNMSAPDLLNFIGGGVWIHHVPSIIDEILSRGEYYTAYTPYQPEISQGMLQGMFEYQSEICELTSMDVANSSMYDWATALGEAGRMAARVTRRQKILVAKNASPERIGVLKTYCYPAGIELEEVNFDPRDGITQTDVVENHLDDSIAAIYVENPNFFGVIEESIEAIADLAHKRGALLIEGVNPVTLGVLKPPGQLGVDIVVGDGQPLGLYPNLGGPLIGLFAIRDDPNLLRQMPGRLIGETTSRDGTRRGFTMVLQTREQHIRREHATSNICTNEALFAIAVAIFLSTMGPQGMRELGQQIIARSHFASELMQEEGLRAPYFNGSYFGELSFQSKIDSIALTKRLFRHNILGGLPMKRFFPAEPRLSNVSSFSFTELHSEEDIEKLVSALKQIESG
ncbi:MAG TPA: aminomethyl-transferring glycine dehydrogenase subunit GcvPA [Nitrososphaerales archaeon]|nr:aminomethyl-transferring glycine dehydrogenase subunit GcvPA [Nitrososphaerales archaeon]